MRPGDGHAMGSKTWLVARHEFAVTIGRLGFRVFAAAVPVIAVLALIGISIFQAVRGEDGPAGNVNGPSAETTSVGYVDLTVGEDGNPLLTSFREQENVVFAPYVDEDAGRAALRADEIAALYVFPRDFLETGSVVRVRMANSSGSAGTAALRGFVLSNLFADETSAARLERIIRPYVQTTVEITESGAPVDDEDDGADFLFFFGAAMLLLVSVLTTAGYLLQGLSEEKENRIMEVLLSSLKPEQLMFGKLLGLGAAGLLQMAIWTTSLVVFLLLFNRVTDAPLELRAPPIEAIAVTLAYFLLGYAFFGTIQAALGVVAASQKEANNIAVFVVLPAVSPMWFLAVLVEHPDGALAWALSLVPFTAPVTGFIRFGLDAMSAAEVALSLGVLAACTALAVWLAARLFRAYLLMYGQRPRIGDIVRTLRGA